MSVNVRSGETENSEALLPLLLLLLLGVERVVAMPDETTSDM